MSLITGRFKLKHRVCPDGCGCLFKKAGGIAPSVVTHFARKFNPMGTKAKEETVVDRLLGFTGDTILGLKLNGQQGFHTILFLGYSPEKTSLLGF